MSRRHGPWAHPPVRAIVAGGASTLDVDFAVDAGQAALEDAPTKPAASDRVRRPAGDIDLGHYWFNPAMSFYLNGAP
ncbi:hypothetical protein C8Q79DRAFT_1010588 [Trametes meyenii]|nr:hypothetical protein C8Q79DRAFT_1010588 [Trametes meyenii]